MAAALRPLIQEADPMVRQRHLARHGRVVTRAVRAPVRPATRGRRVVSGASARRIVGRLGMNRHARLDLPIVGNLSSTIVGTLYGRFGQVLRYGSSLKS
jgi:hypothetical protein